MVDSDNRKYLPSKLLKRIKRIRTLAAIMSQSSVAEYSLFNNIFFDGLPDNNAIRLLSYIIKNNYFRMLFSNTKRRKYFSE